MGFYQRHVLPHLITFAMSNEDLLAYRKRVVPAALGRVLEIGIGSGLNLPFYRDSVEEIVGLDSSPELLALAARRPETTRGRCLHLVQASAEAIPLDSRSADTVVMTWTLCSVREPGRALEEIRRVLRPSGQLLFVEHGAAPDAGVARWQDRLTPLWKRIAGGCHLNRNVAKLLREEGFMVSDISTGYMRGPRVATFMYEGRARPS
jgi:ubiquinone/menaquinone biosynthesis C-methylase UbiE